MKEERKKKEKKREKDVTTEQAPIKLNTLNRLMRNWPWRYSVCQEQKSQL
jgi:hypothetical protein